MHMKTLAALAATAALALGATACGGSDDESADEPPTPRPTAVNARRRDPVAERPETPRSRSTPASSRRSARSSSRPRRSATAEISKAGVASFPITGGNVTYYTPGTVSPYVQGMIAHDGSGLSLTGGGKTVELTDFAVDPGKSVLTGKVTVDGAGRGRERAAVLPRRPHAEAAGDQRRRHRRARGHDRQAQGRGRRPAQPDVRRRGADRGARDRRREDHRQRGVSASAALPVGGGSSGPPAGRSRSFAAAAQSMTARPPSTTTGTSAPGAASQAA